MFHQDLVKPFTNKKTKGPKVVKKGKVQKKPRAKVEIEYEMEEESQQNKRSCRQQNCAI